MKTSARLMVFAKAPLAGQVKTRLIPLLGPEGAAQLQAQLLEHTVGMACASHLATVELWLSGDVTSPWIEELAVRHRLTLFQQQGRDLGERMAHAFAVQEQTPCKALIIGTDCPTMDAAVLQQALEALDEVDVVLQPAEDGGYTLIGMRDYWPQLFKDIAWGSSQVLTQSLERAESLGLKVRLLPLAWDLDRPEDYQRAVDEGLIRIVVKEGEL